MANLNKADTGKLQRAIEGRNSSQGYVLATKQEFKALLDGGLVEANETIKDGSKVAMRASDAGVTAWNALNPTGATTAPAGGVDSGGNSFKITKGIALPAIKRRVGEVTGSKYPFDAMEAPGPEGPASFHVPKTAEMPNPAKSIASSVTAANMRYAEKAEGTHKTPKGKEVQNVKYTRHYQIRAVGKDDPDGEGARIWRTK